MELDCLVSGYIKREFLNDHRYPESLNAIFIQFLGNILFKFDLFHAMYQQFIQNYGTTFKALDWFEEDDTFPIGCSYPFTTGIYNVVIKWYAWNLADFATYNPIGICSDTDCCKRKKDWIFDNKEIYIYALYGSNFAQSKACDQHGSSGTQSSVYLWATKSEEEFTMIIDCNQWTLTYFVDAKQVGVPINIAKNTKYYLFVCAQFAGEYEIVSCVHQK